MSSEDRDFLFSSLEDLEREYAAGDMDLADYEALKSSYVKRLADVLRDTEVSDELHENTDVIPERFTKCGYCLRRELGFVFMNSVDTDRIDEIERCAEPEDGSDIGCSGLEAMRGVLVGRFFRRGIRHHPSADLVRGKRGKQRLFPIEHADAGRTKTLVAGEGEEVAIPRVYVDF